MTAEERWDKHRRAERPTSALLSDLARLGGELVQEEFALARAELRENVGRVAGGAVFIGVAAALGFAGLLALLAAAILALSNVVSPWLAAAIVGGVTLMAAAGAGYYGRVNMSRLELTPSRTLRTLRDSARWAREQVQ